MVFYNIELKCYVLIDLKTGRITHQDVGQIDMYVRMYDDLKCKEGEILPLGFCSALRPTRILPDIPYCMIMNGCSCPST